MRHALFTTNIIIHLKDNRHFDIYFHSTMLKRAGIAFHTFFALTVFTGLGHIGNTANAQGTSAAPNWPTRPVRIIVPSTPGGGTDVFARILAQRLSEVYGQQFIVDNRPGAGSTIGHALIASGKLQPVFGEKLSLEVQGHFLVYPARHAARAEVQHFLQWLKEEADI